MTELIRVGTAHGFGSSQFLEEATRMERVRLRLMGYNVPLFRILVRSGITKQRDYQCSHCAKKFRGSRKICARTFCSMRCYSLSKRGPSNPNYKGGPVIHPCKICGHLFTAKRNISERRVTCSKECHKESFKLWRKICPVQQKLNRLVRRRILSSLKKGVKNNRRWRDILPYSAADLKAHLEGLFREGMTWDNHGVKGWHIDHVRPVASFKFTTMEDSDFLECWSLKNLQPLWAIDNLSKSDKYGARN